MTWAIVEYKCGHKDCICVYGDKVERERILESCKKSPCQECEEKEERNERARQKASYGLYGTLDQIDEARAIKDSILKSLNEEECNSINEIDDAEWWIINRKAWDLARTATNVGKGIRELKSLTLPPLQGTPGEIYWASKIREKALYYEFGLVAAHHKEELIECLQQISDAKWWIKYHRRSPEVILELARLYPNDERYKDSVYKRD